MNQFPATSVPVHSTLIASMAYEAHSALLHLEFHDGTYYRYFGVPGEVYEGLLAAPSKGFYFNRCIRGSFPYTLLRPSV